MPADDRRSDERNYCFAKSDDDISFQGRRASRDKMERVMIRPTTEELERRRRAQFGRTIMGVSALLLPPHGLARFASAKRQT